VGKELSSIVNTKAPDFVEPYSNDSSKIGELKALGNIQVGARYQLFNKKWVGSLQVLLLLPTAQYQHSTGLQSGYNATGITPTINVGRGFEKKYFQASIGTSLKTNGYASYFVGKLEYGWRLSSKEKPFWLVTVLDAYLAINKGTYQDGNELFTGLSQNGEEWVSPGIKISKNITKRLAINAGVYGALHAKCGGAFPTLNFGVSFEN
jgi:hypothetical protein